MKSYKRREVLKGIALAGSAVLFSPNSLLSATLPKKRLGVALVGLGYYSSNLLAPALLQTSNCYLAGVVTGTPSKAEDWSKKYNIPDKNIYNYENFDSIKDNDDIDVVYVVLPPSMHKEFTVRAANAGKHVWCEKPMAISVEECQTMIEACRKNKKSLAIGYRLQHEPNTWAYRNMIKRRQLGNLKHINCGAGYFERRTDHWKQRKEMGGGALYDMGVYAIQGARLGSGMEPVSILSASLSTKRPEVYNNGLVDTAVATLEFPGGVTADIKTSFAENINFLDITSERGEINMAPFSNYNGIQGKSTLGEIKTAYDVPWQQAKQMDDDALSILQGKPMIVPGEEGLRDIRIVQAILRSAEKGQIVKL